LAELSGINKKTFGRRIFKISLKP